MFFFCFFSFVVTADILCAKALLGFCFTALQLYHIIRDWRGGIPPLPSRNVDAILVWNAETSARQKINKDQVLTCGEGLQCLQSSF